MTLAGGLHDKRFGFCLTEIEIDSEQRCVDRQFRSLPLSLGSATQVNQLNYSVIGATGSISDQNPQLDSFTAHRLIHLVLERLASHCRNLDALRSQTISTIFSPDCRSVTPPDVPREITRFKTAKFGKLSVSMYRWSEISNHINLITQNVAVTASTAIF
jgi:hypothetical protein